MAFKLNRSSKEPMSEINVTPFVDVMLVLINYFYGNSSFTNRWSAS
jgi:biopolymer transport protein TolR